MIDEPVIEGWECPKCLRWFAEHGYCFFDGTKLIVVVEQIDEL